MGLLDSTRHTSSITPSAAAITSWKGVPTRAIRLQGLRTLSPATATTRSMRGIPLYTARQAAAAVAALNTAQPLSLGRRALTAR